MRGKVLISHCSVFSSPVDIPTSSDIPVYVMAFFIKSKRSHEHWNINIPSELGLSVTNLKNRKIEKILLYFLIDRLNKLQDY